jgi:hypothetical protein
MAERQPGYVNIDQREKQKMQERARAHRQRQEQEMQQILNDQMPNLSAATLLPPEKPIPPKTYVPIGCLVATHLIRPKTRPSGLVMPDNATEGDSTPTALVIAVGPEVKGVKEGQIVVVNVTGRPLRVVHATDSGYHETIVMREDQIIGVVIKEEEKKAESEATLFDGVK